MPHAVRHVYYILFKHTLRAELDTEMTTCISGRQIHKQAC